MPLRLWFAAIHLIVTAKNGVSSVELGRRLGVRQPTAWAMKHKIMAVMARREGEKRLSGRVEMDDACLGGRRSGGKRGRGAAGKTPFVAAVSTGPEGCPRKPKLAPVRGFRKREIARGAAHWLAPDGVNGADEAHRGAALIIARMRTGEDPVSEARQPQGPNLAVLAERSSRSGFGTGLTPDRPLASTSRQRRR